MIKLFVLLLFCLLSPLIAVAQDSAVPQNLLFDDADIIVTAEEPKAHEEQASKPNREAADHALDSARKLLSQRPVKLQHKNFQITKKAPLKKNLQTGKTREAPFGLIWGESIADTKNQGVFLTPVEMKDYKNSYSANRLSKKIDFFDHVFVVYGEEDELYRILAYSILMDDDASASKALQAYQTYSALLEKKYGNKKEDFTPATLTKTVKNNQGKEETVTETAPIGNPDFLEQLQNGTAVLFSTYQDNDVAAALSIGVDGDKKSYIVIDYKNLNILKKQENKTLEAL